MPAVDVLSEETLRSVVDTLVLLVEAVGAGARQARRRRGHPDGTQLLPRARDP